MAPDYFTDGEDYIVNQPLPSPSDTPYNSLSQRSSRYGTPGERPPTAPAPLPPDEHNEKEDVANDESISPLDPRRFTPTLHASLVSEILSLRREIDSKHKVIEDLETNLHTVRNENDVLTSELSNSTKESRAAKRQLQQLENGTLAALEELAEDRDKFKEANTEMKEKVEAMQKKLKSQEDDSTRVHDMWAREKETWNGEKRALERRVHVSESRLKMLLDELATHDPIHEEAMTDSETDEHHRDSGVGPESDAGSVRSSPQRRPSSRFARHSRNQSNGSFRSIGRNYRMSYMSAAGSDGHARTNGPSLADELTFDEEEEDLEEMELDSDDYMENEMRARRALESRQSMYHDEKAKRILGLPSESLITANDDLQSSTDTEVPSSKPNGFFHRFSRAIIPPKELKEVAEDEVETPRPNGHTLVFPPHTPDRLEKIFDDLPPKPQYVDTGVQPSPPPSPKRPDSASPGKVNESLPSNVEVEANQSRKRVSAATPNAPTHSQHDVPTPMISTSSQTIEQPLSPPATPKITIPIVQTPISPVFSSQVASVSTQTEDLEVAEPKSPAPPSRAAPPVPIPIPSIAIHPPLSRPGSPREPVLPPGTKSISTQTLGDLSTPMRSISTQTESIRIDKRPVKLPPHLLPSAISSKPGTPEPGQERPVPPKSPNRYAHLLNNATSKKPSDDSAVRHTNELMAMLQRTVEIKAETKIEDRYPGNNDNGPLARNKENGLRRPFRDSSLFAGFDGGGSSDEEDQEPEMSDEDDPKPTKYGTPGAPSRALKHSKPFNNPPTPVPEEKEVVSKPRPSEDSMSSSRMYSSNRNSMESISKVGKPIRTSLSRQPSIRRSAMIQSGTVAHHRSRSPSFGSIASGNFVAKPPFPVPTRSSSRRIPLSKSEGSQSPTPRGSGQFPGRRPYGMRQHQRKDSLRKVRSAAVIHKPGRSRSRSPPLPATPIMPDSPALPPLPNDMIAGQNFGHRHQFSTQTANTGTTSTGSSGQTSVVDAIAATMVGEWMWKYVRKRKTFGPPDAQSPQEIARAEEASSVMGSNGARHKRWVWISPYERAVLWSSKQPTSGSALMGKSGRKLTIQSVLDVADNTPLPKGASAQETFNRSILILTPARALKFTCFTRERHYLWLTALSFLAHSSSPIPELEPLPAAPPPPVEEFPPRNGGATLRRTHVRDSVRLAKGKTNPVAARHQAAKLDPIQDWYNHSTMDSKPVADAASPPSIPRGPFHGRKRSSTGPRAPPPSVGDRYRSFSHQHVPSVYSSGSSDFYKDMPPSVPSSVYNPQSVITSGRTSEASTSTRQNFFDSMGTVRMEAFIEPILQEDKAHNSKFQPRMGRRRGNSHVGNDYRSNVGGHDEYDPFRNF